MGGAAHRHGIQPGAGQVADRGLVGDRQHQGQRSWPEARGEPLSPLVEARDPPCRRHVGHVSDQRVEARPALGRIDRRHRTRIGSVSRQAIDRLGGQDDKTASLQRGGGFRDLG